MASQLEQEGASLTSVVTGIVHDAQDLVRQQLKLFQVEIRNDTRRTIAATVPMVIGGILCLVALIVLAVMAAHLISWAWPEHVPLWGGYAIVGGTFALVGVALVLWGKAKFSTFSPLPDQTMEGLKENIQWKTKK
jgi:uncharacterized membrane protein YqjE